MKEEFGTYKLLLLALYYILLIFLEVKGKTNLT